MIKQNMTIFFVEDQAAATSFYQKVFAIEPSLNVPGMTEFQLSNATGFGIMPQAGIKTLLGEQHFPAPDNKFPTAELYLIVDEPAAYLERAIKGGAELILALEPRDWGDKAAYCLTPDGHILAFAEPLLDGVI